MVRKFRIVIIIIKIHCLQYKYSFVTNYTVTLHYTDSSVIAYAVQCTCGKFGSFSMIITMIVAHCTDSTHFLSNLPIILHYSVMLEHTYSQNYASIIGQGLVVELWATCSADSALVY